MLFWRWRNSIVAILSVLRGFVYVAFPVSLCGTTTSLLIICGIIGEEAQTGEVGGKGIRELVWGGKKEKKKQKNPAC